eukprot:TRINITY_DN14755_c0_g1_i1.p2 TRINITY_DN14755_c0_g1~~TRINITY_DN14755_c0_g1_i1.p2  ORF type:complete len:413 (+),score=215.01 TRINITY_DN14755_c0_g1_i1:60-1241(+)
MLPVVQRRFISATARCCAAYKDKAGGILFTPGPLSTTASVKQAMMTDFGSRDHLFIEKVKYLRKGLLDVAGVSDSEYTCIPMQGSGSMGVEAVLSSMIPAGGKILIFRNGAYGDRIHNICKRHGIEAVFVDGAEDGPIPEAEIEAQLKQHPDVSMVTIVHCETSTGVFNPIQSVRDLMDKHTPNALYFIDAMSSFGGVGMDFAALRPDVVVSSSNKCVQGVPGFSIVIAKKAPLEATKEHARTYTLDLHMQDAGLNKSGQFNNTPPVQSIMAFARALEELEEEGGVPAREQRYKNNQVIVTEGMKRLGFQLYLDDSKSSFGHIISSFRFPTCSNWDFNVFYNKLNDLGFVIYPGKAAKAPCFRIGHIGDVQNEDSEALLAAIDTVLKEMKVTL